jgi:thiamine monophosphate synthase
MTAIIEARPYGPDSTPDELEALRSRVSFHGNATVLYREVPVLSEFQIDVVCDRVEELCRVHDCSFLIVDLGASARPDAALRAKLEQRISLLEGRVRHLGLITTHMLIRIALKFLAARLPVSVSVHSTLAEAEEAIRHHVTD